MIDGLGDEDGEKVGSVLWIVPAKKTLVVRRGRDFGGPMDAGCSGAVRKNSLVQDY